MTDGTAKPITPTQPNAPVVLNPYRNEVLEEVAREMEKFTFAFGVDTVESFTAFVRGMKE